MRSEQVIKSKYYDFIAGQVNKKAPETIINDIALQLERANEARERIEEEGVIVRSDKGVVIAHPALAVEKQAQEKLEKMIYEWS